MRVADKIVQELLNFGVKNVYTLCGGFSQIINDAIGHSELNPVYFLHESGAAFAACGEASYTHKLSVCIITSGPGSTNAITGCANAWMDSLPVLFISGDAKVNLLMERDKYHLREAGPQDVPIKHMIEHITKMSVMTMFAPAVCSFMKQAIEHALEPRMGPVWLSVPLDVQGQEI